MSQETKRKFKFEQNVPLYISQADFFSFKKGALDKKYTSNLYQTPDFPTEKYHKPIETYEKCI